MIVSRIILFLFGTAITAGAFLPSPPTEILISKNKHALADTEYLPSSGKSPFISNFIQKGTNVFFKPQFMLSAAQMPPQVQEVIAAIEKDNCKTLYPLGPVPVVPVMEEPLRVIEKEMVTLPEIKEIVEINTAPVMPPLKMPMRPVLVEKVPIVEEFLPKRPLSFVEERVVLPPTETVEIFEHISPMGIHEAPILPPLVTVDAPAPVIIKEPFTIEKIDRDVIKVIPPAPVLPPLEMPSIVVEETNLIPNLPGEKNIAKPVMLPAAPLLPPYIPARPVFIEEKPIVVPQPPEFPSIPFTLPKNPFELIVEEKIVEKPVAPCDTVEIIDELVQPALIPESPVLAPLIPSPLLVNEPVVEIKEIKPLVPPPAPLLPPLELPQRPIIVERPADVIVAPCPPEPEIHVAVKPNPIPYVYPNLAPMKPHLRPIVPAVDCADDVVVQHILPHMEVAYRPHAEKITLPFTYFP